MTSQLKIRLPKDLHKLLVESAKARGLSLNKEMVERLLSTLDDDRIITEYFLRKLLD